VPFSAWPLVISVFEDPLLAGVFRVNRMLIELIDRKSQVTLSSEVL
jgi:hypothetical protein